MKVYQDRIFLLLLLNAVLVLVGYALVIFTAGAIQSVMFWVKAFVFLISLMNLLTVPYHYLYHAMERYKPYWILSIFLLCSAIYASDPLYSLLRTCLFILPLWYVYCSMYVLCYKYSVKQVEQSWVYALLLIYLIPAICLVLSGNLFTSLNLYYIRSTAYESIGFVSNHYGWSSTIVLACSLTLLATNKSPKQVSYWLLVTLSLLSTYIIIASGNRTSWLVLFLLICRITYQRFNRISGQQLMLVFGIGIMIFIFVNDADSAISLRLAKTYSQLEAGESRVNRLWDALSYVQNNWIVLLVGWGMFSPPEELVQNMHNSYYEVLFGVGLPVFIGLCRTLVYLPLISIAKNNTLLVLVLIPLLIIPYFESNLTIGQFLYMPWFGSVLINEISGVLNKQRHGKIPCHV